MSQLVSEFDELDLRNGLTWAAVLRVSRTRQRRRKIIWEAQVEDSPVSVSVGLDYTDGFKLWVVDFEGTTHPSPTIAADRFCEEWNALFAFFGPKEESTLCLGVSVNDGVGEERNVEATMGDPGPARASMGAAVKGTHASTMKMRTMLLYDRPLSPIDRVKVWDVMKRDGSLG